MAKTIVVVGATGIQGGAVATKFLSLGWNVRGITRNTSSPSAQALSNRGIEVVSVDQDDLASLITAFSGAEVIFAVTNFWEPFFKKYEELSKQGDRATGGYAAAIEVCRGKAMVDAAAKVLQDESKLERFIWSPLPSFKEFSKGKYSYAYHFDSKAEVTKYLQLEQKDLWEKSSLLNMGIYTTNVKDYEDTFRPKKTNDGSGEWIFPRVSPVAAEHPFVVPADTGAFVELLVRSPPKQNLLGVSESASFVQFFDVWGQVTGKIVTCKEVPIEARGKPHPGGLEKEASNSTTCSGEFGWGDVVVPKDLNPNVKLTSLKEFFESEDWTEFE
ncbi:uncharacterized protein EAF01_004544 [Botrytis porri]|uniref:NmrA-like domain-containing protein n=1 Tax=Botrytis porri TaxID=87229 RepID=A0A4Z1K6W2_9HELO|nr:uncharacterized protein EAF01_004544 [Botrytis porri]KAF7908789.1 hypothetical protein EAF01_004544 [Botrytis porri]TGO81236.1 hypothetical protein BPOR_1255g00010 [Botrytis porri]